MVNTLKLLDKEKKNLSVLGIELFGDTGLLIHGRSSRSDQQRNENPMRGRRKQVKKKRCSLPLSLPSRLIYLTTVERNGKKEKGNHKSRSLTIIALWFYARANMVELLLRNV